MRPVVLLTCFLFVAPLRADVRELSGHKGEVTAVVFHPSGKLLATTSIDGTLRLWDLPEGKLRQSLMVHTGGCYAAVFAPDGKWLATAGADKLVRIFDSEWREARRLEGHRNKVAALAVAADGKLLASGDYDGIIRLWDPATGNEQRPSNGFEKEGVVPRLAFAPDGKTLYSGGSAPDEI